MNQDRYIGYTDRCTVKLDFDHISLQEVIQWSDRAYNWYELEGYCVLRSSENCYHVIFDRTVDWSTNVSVMAWVCLQSKNPSLTKWFKMQGIKEGSTLRISTKQEKPAPALVYKKGSQCNEIQEYWELRHVIEKYLDEKYRKFMQQGEMPLYVV
ncbi:MAG: hypothetical protein ACTSW1_14165 [Candidatus Hodarchaeales archaeon]